MFCEHVYKVVGAEICPSCGKDTHETNWEVINEARRKHREEHGILHNVPIWWSI